MDLSRIRLGIIAWFLGILIPTMHHALLHWPIGAIETRNYRSVSSHVFEHMPWIDFVYLGVMALTGTVLLVTGLRSKAKDEGEE